MKKEDRVTSLELSRHMRELGWNYETEFWWMTDELKQDFIVLLRANHITILGNPDIQYHPAPDAQEIAQQLPAEIICEDTNYGLVITKIDLNDWAVRYSNFGKDLFEPIDPSNSYTLSEALGKVWCHLKERKTL